MRSKSPDEVYAAALRLASSADRSAIAEALRVLGEPGVDPELRDDFAHGLVEATRDTNDALIALLEEDPGSERGRLLADVLGQRALVAAPEDVGDIEAALVRSLGRVAPAGTWPASGVLSGLAYAVRAKPAPEAIPSVEVLLARATEEEEPYMPAVLAALEVLVGTLGAEASDRLRAHVGRARDSVVDTALREALIRLET